jgi:hypothetical protein
MIRPHALVTLLACFSPCLAQDDRAPVEPRSLPAPDQPVAEVRPSVEKLDETRYRVGKVTFDRKTREVRFPGQINMTDGLLEFLIVHEKGKIHESLFVTDVSPTDINLALTLLRYQPSAELYPLPNPSGGLSGEFPEVPEDVKRAARVSIEVEWNDGGKTKRHPVNEWIRHAVKESTMPSGPWVYGGSRFFDGKFGAETTGDIVAIFVTIASLINYPGEDNWDDTVWFVHPGRVPPEGTNVTLIIAPYKNTVEAKTP